MTFLKKNDSYIRNVQRKSVLPGQESKFEAEKNDVGNNGPVCAAHQTAISVFFENKIVFPWPNWVRKIRGSTIIIIKTQ